MAASYLLRLSAGDPDTARRISESLVERLGADVVHRPEAVILNCISCASPTELATAANEVVQRIAPGRVSIVVYPMDQAPWAEYRFEGPALKAHNLFDGDEYHEDLNPADEGR